MQQFSSLDDEVGRTLENTRRLIKSVSGAVGESRKNLYSQVERNLDSVESMVRKMTTVAQGAPNAVAMDTKIRTRNAELQQLRRELLLMAPSTPFSTPAQKYGSMQDEQTTRIAAGTEKLQNTSDALGRIQAASYDSEETGKGALHQLQDQRGQLENASNTMDHMDDNVNKGNQLLRSMWMNLTRNMIVQVIIIILLILAILGVIFFAWIMPLFW
ncbi:hypothetical protein Pelo_6933 [Pelomyxa schiedti]|nr:hypothetical protein Pelo_6933 [Pelomyxa schiedti]